MEVRCLRKVSNYLSKKVSNDWKVKNCLIVISIPWNKYFEDMLIGAKLVEIKELLVCLYSAGHILAI